MSDRVETTDFPVRPIVITFGALLLGLLAILGVMALIYQFDRASIPVVEGIGHGPTYLTDIESGRRKLHERFAKNLTGPRWIDRGKGIVAIPIDQAIDRIATDGQLPTWRPSNVPPAP
ncbi:hypothetical protein [Haloferula sargassicola]|uniref:Uncharacterized protein n=1 Tax=Haloferula sargassicola TaxID=490096 RepID=A0ABP9UI26_9BACT